MLLNNACLFYKTLQVIADLFENSSCRTLQAPEVNCMFLP